MSQSTTPPSDALARICADTRIETVKMKVFK